MSEGSSLADNNEESTWAASQRIYDSCLHCSIVFDEDDCYYDGWLNPSEQLDAFLEDYSTRPVDRCNPGCLELRNVVITRRIITLLRPLLLVGCDEASSSLNGHNENRDVSRGSETATMFSSARIENSGHLFSQADTTTRDHELLCTPDDKYFFFSALARCTDKLKIENYDAEFLSDFLNITEIDHLEAESLRIAQPVSLTEFEYLRLGAIIQNSVRTTSLDLELPFGNAPQAFCNNFSNSIHVQSLTVSHFPQMSDEHKAASLAEIIANEDGNGALEGLLRNPQNQLTALSLDITTLEVFPAMVIAQLLRNSRVEVLTLFSDSTHPTVLLEFYRQLPTMHSLVGISLSLNPFVEYSPEVLEECGAALLHGLIENPFIQRLGGMENFPQSAMLYHYLFLNRAGRKILLRSSSYGEQHIPAGLWPHILSRAGRPDESWEYQCYQYGNTGPANAVYFFLRNCPKIFSWQE